MNHQINSQILKHVAWQYMDGVDLESAPADIEAEVLAVREFFDGVHQEDWLKGDIEDAIREWLRELPKPEDGLREFTAVLAKKLRKATSEGVYPLAEEAAALKTATAALIDSGSLFIPLDGTGQWFFSKLAEVMRQYLREREVDAEVIESWVAHWAARGGQFLDYAFRGVIESLTDACVRHMAERGYSEFIDEAARRGLENLWFPHEEARRGYRRKVTRWYHVRQVPQLGDLGWSDWQAAARILAVAYHENPTRLETNQGWEEAAREWIHPPAYIDRWGRRVEPDPVEIFWQAVEDYRKD